MKHRILCTVALAGCIASNADVVAESGDAGSPGVDAAGSAGDIGPLDAHFVPTPRDAAPTPDRDAVAPPDAAPPGPDWSLPPCDRACDRVTDCGVAACPGFDWSSAGLLNADCLAVCDASLASAVEGAVDCPAVLDAARPVVDTLGEPCESNPCDAACDRFVDCIVVECAAIDEAAGAGIARDCRATCRPQDAAWVLSVPTCGELVGAIAENDPAFRTACDGNAGCAPAEVCAPFAERLAGCIVAHCDGHADAFQQGLAEALYDSCATAEDCPDPADVAALSAPEVTCESDALRDLGHGDPIRRLCEGELGVTAEQLYAVCEALVACPGFEGLGVERCMVYLAFDPETQTKTECLEAAAGACASAGECL